MDDRTGGELLAESLIARGVDTVFGIPGVQLDAAADALHARSERLRFVCARNEQATTYMADGYARSTGRVGVAMVVPGPGVLNALAGMSVGYGASSRVLLVAGQIDSRAIGRGLGALHELPDQTGILERITKWTGTARTAAEVPGLLDEAFHQVRSGRPRPVAVELPPDVLAGRAAVEIPRERPDDLVSPQPADVAAAAARLRAAQRPVIVAGGGVLASGASEDLVRLAEALGAPVVVTDNGRGAIDARHLLAFDPLALRELRRDADLVLVVGSRFVTAFGEAVDVAGADVILVNADEADLGAPRSAVLTMVADAALALRALTAELGTPTRAPRTEELAAARRQTEDQLADISPQRDYLRAIREALPDDGVLVGELTQVGYAAGACYPTYRPGTFIGPGYQGALGYGFATALGVKAADPARAVASITGDGGFSWTMQELSTMKRYGLGVVVVIFRDGHFGNVRRIQKNRYGGRFFASDLTNPDYPALAAAFGIASATVSGPAELGRVLAEAVRADEPMVIDVPVGEFPSPWHLIHEGVPRPTTP